MTPREILNELKWREDRDLTKAEIWYYSRGTERGHVVITGGELTELGKSFFETASATIPYYKIFRIVYGNEVIFDREQLEKKRFTHI
ncbi:MAG: DUF504 domain-containing protein [Methanomassiliicoccales archaeon]|nr:MAG: DUF504 domain-containing protein [Methanomassiliicoccales archaeon]